MAAEEVKEVAVKNNRSLHSRLELRSNWRPPGGASEVSITTTLQWTNEVCDEINDHSDDGSIGFIVNRHDR